MMDTEDQPRTEVLDAYDVLFDELELEPARFFERSLAAIKDVDPASAEEDWNALVERLENGGTAFIRGAGRNAQGTEAWFKVCRHLFKNADIRKDPDNNTEPTKLLTRLTRYGKVTEKGEGIRHLMNYQVSHLWEKRTHNPLLFTAAWNIAWVPKYLDPFTGHETKGEHVVAFQKRFRQRNRERYGRQIAAYNAYVKANVLPRLEEALVATISELQGWSVRKVSSFESRVRQEFAVI